MKAQNETTDHNRTILVTDIPGDGLKELLITVNYVVSKNDGGLIEKAVCLDGHVIPAIIKGVNEQDGPRLFTPSEIACLQILEQAKLNRDFADETPSAKRWDRIAGIAHKALGCPSAGTLQDMKIQMADHQSYADLAASGGIVDAP